MTLTYLVSVALILEILNADLQCIDNDGKTVDWWYAYKLNDGTEYAYFDGSSTDTKLWLG